ALLERAETIFADSSLDPLELARARFGLARALVDSGGDRQRAAALAELAREAYVADTVRGPTVVETIDAWRLAQGLPPA
ncbi:MAG: hypothetical protein K0V04_12675, partial [Deltaproteobacteria bacterium]|nr:hypothetical protein [Deltaproteobacteria bacterium]